MILQLKLYDMVPNYLQVPLHHHIDPFINISKFTLNPTMLSLANNRSEYFITSSHCLIIYND